MAKGDPILREGGYVKPEGQSSAEWFEHYLATAADIIEKAERTGHVPERVLNRQYTVLSEIGRELNLSKPDSEAPNYLQALSKIEVYRQSGDYAVLSGTASLIRADIQAIVNRANRFSALDQKVSASAGSSRVLKSVAERLRTSGRTYTSTPAQYEPQRTGTDG